MIDSLNDPRLLYRRQFFLGPSFVKFPGIWKKLNLVDQWFLTVQDDLEVSMADDGSRYLVLLGFAFDCRNSEKTHQQILDHLLGFSSFEDIANESKYLAGRWIIIYLSASEEKIFHDVTGCRQIYYYYDEKSNRTWCASQPHTLAKVLNISPDPDPALHTFMQSDAFKNEENAWIGDGTPYQNLKHLHANFFLDLKKNVAERYWPLTNLTDCSFDEAVDKGASILQTLIKAAFHRYPIAVALTGGLDSRILLSVSRQLADKLNFFVFRKKWMTYDFKDVIIPKKLAKRFKLNFTSLEVVEPPKHFINALKASTYLSLDYKIDNHYTMFLHLQDKLIIGGNIAPLIKSRWHVAHKDKEVTACLLAEIYGRKGDQYAEKQAGAWLEKTEAYLKRFNINNISIFDLYWWENGEANWNAFNTSSSDIAVERFFPLNCRYLLEVILSTAPKLRTPKDYLYQKTIIKHLWPELLKLDINPSGKSPKLINLLYRLNMYSTARRIYRLMKWK